jgi:hypothetical protein
MHCSSCNFVLSIQDLDRTEWVNDSEEFIFICSNCKNETKLVSFLFNQEHINEQYLETIVADVDNEEKYLDYVPNKQKEYLLNHLKKCLICSDKLESLRLKNISRQIITNEKTYNFFMSQAKQIGKKLTCSEITINCIGIKSFIFNQNLYKFSKRNLFYNHLEHNKNYLCYFLENDSHIIGMVSFIKMQDEVLLDKIWVKSEERIEKEKRLLRNLKCADVKILYDLVNKKFSFL